MRLVLISLLVVLLAGCSSTNQVERLISDTTVVKHSEQPGYHDRYSNLYDAFKDYPVSCEQDCYPATPLIECQQEMENCQYIGSKPDVNIEAGFQITWLGHASFVITSQDGNQFLFDPVSEQFDWPVNWAFYLSEGFNRQPAAQLSPNQWQATDAVMYSHIHYDHFNKADIKKLNSSTQFLVPLGFAEHFDDNGFSITEMAWYASREIGETTAHFVPAHHFSSRILVPYLYEDSDKTLWGGWLLENNGKTLFFAGDTGYSPHFKDIQAKYGDIDVCLLPIASYFSAEYPKWYRKVHTTPEDALVAADDLNCKVVVPWGYGNASWKMGDISSHSALFRLLHMHKQLKSDIPLYILNEGEQVSF